MRSEELDRIWGFLSPAMRLRIENEERRYAKDLCKNAVNWSDDIKWKKFLAIRAESFKPLDLFPELTPQKEIDPNKVKNNAIFSKDKRWILYKKIWPKYERVSIVGDNVGRKKGYIVFDGDLEITALHYRKYENFDCNPMMSLMPMELMTLKWGTRYAEGHTVIGGLGLGHQLIEVSKRKQVNRITLIEISESLTAMLWPYIEPHLQKKVEIVHDDVYKALPKMKADTALIDIFPTFGCDFEKGELAKTCPNIRKLWCWGGGGVVAK